MEIHGIGYHQAHDSSFVTDRPEGCGQSWLFLIFHTPATVRIDGRDTQVPADTCMICSAGKPQYYAACGEHYMDDWFLFTVERMDTVLFRELDIPLDVPVPLSDAAECSAIVRCMTNEHSSAKLYHVDIIELYMKILFIQISRQVHAPRISPAQKACGRHDQLVALRWRIFHQIETVGSVSELAEELSVSVSSLQHSYKSLFGENLTHDIALSRVEKAKLLLSATDLPLRLIAEQSGYHNEFHMMRQFKERTGMTASAYRATAK